MTIKSQGTGNADVPLIIVVSPSESNSSKRTPPSPKATSLPAQTPSSNSSWLLESTKLISEPKASTLALTTTLWMEPKFLEQTEQLTDSLLMLKLEAQELLSTKLFPWEGWLILLNSLEAQKTLLKLKTTLWLLLPWMQRAKPPLYWVLLDSAPRCQEYWSWLRPSSSNNQH